MNGIHDAQLAALQTWKNSGGKRRIVLVSPPPAKGNRRVWACECWDVVPVAVGIAAHPSSAIRSALLTLAYPRTT